MIDTRMTKDSSICVIYAARSGSSNNLDNFEYLYAMKVGISLAMLWMSWAWVAEKNRNYHLTDMIFRKALEKGAQPIHVVEERYDHYRQRMSRNVSDVTAAALNMSTAMPIGRGVVPSNQCNKYELCRIVVGFYCMLFFSRCLP